MGWNRYPFASTKRVRRVVTVIVVASLVATAGITTGSHAEAEAKVTGITVSYSCPQNNFDFEYWVLIKNERASDVSGEILEFDSGNLVSTTPTGNLPAGGGGGPFRYGSGHAQPNAEDHRMVVKIDGLGVASDHDFDCQPGIQGVDVTGSCGAAGSENNVMTLTNHRSEAVDVQLFVGSEESQMEQGIGNRIVPPGGSETVDIAKGYETAQASVFAAPSGAVTIDYRRMGCGPISQVRITRSNCSGPSNFNQVWITNDRASTVRLETRGIDSNDFDPFDDDGVEEPIGSVDLASGDTNIQNIDPKFEAIRLVNLDAPAEKQYVGFPIDCSEPPPTTTTTAATTTTTTVVPPRPTSLPAVVRGIHWFLRDQLSSGPGSNDFLYGDPGDAPLLCDWDGDGIRTPGVRRGIVFYLRNGGGGGLSDISPVAFGDPGDIPICGDWDGDGKESIGVVRIGEWFLLNRITPGNDPAGQHFFFGDPGDMPLVGDWDGDGDANPGVRRGIAWLRRSENSSGVANLPSLLYGDPGDAPIVGDWDGDGTPTPGVVRGNQWFLRRTALPGERSDDAIFYGDSGDWPLVWASR